MDRTILQSVVVLALCPVLLLCVLCESCSLLHTRVENSFHITKRYTPLFVKGELRPVNYYSPIAQISLVLQKSLVSTSLKNTP